MWRQGRSSLDRSVCLHLPQISRIWHVCVLMLQPVIHRIRLMNRNRMHCAAGRLGASCSRLRDSGARKPSGHMLPPACLVGPRASL